MTNSSVNIINSLEKWKLTQCVTGLESSVIRELLKTSSRPGMISFTGGLPAPELFPIEKLKQLSSDVLEKYGPSALQYSLSAGIKPFRELLAERANARGLSTCIDNILITAGAQQGIELLARSLLNPGDYVLVENPSYPGALQIFNYYQAQYATVEMDDNGMITDQVEDILKRYRPKLIYTVSDSQNPTGISISLERRKELVRLAAEYAVPIIDDNPYGRLQFAGETIPSLKSLGGDGVLAVRTFSKLVCPGIRVGWINGHADLIKQLEKVKQFVDLHANTFWQYMMLEFIQQGFLEPHVEAVRRDYQRKRDCMLEALQEFFPEEISWTRPKGGMFIWLTLPESLSAKQLFEKGIEKKVAYVYGEPFFPLAGIDNTLRLSYSNSSLENIREGIRRLAEVFKTELNRS